MVAQEIGLNRLNAIVGYSLGGTLSVALMIIGAAFFLPDGISPEHLGSVALGPQDVLGRIGLLLALVGNPVRRRRSLDRYGVRWGIQLGAILSAGNGAATATQAGRRGSH